MSRPFYKGPFPADLVHVDVEEPHQLAAWCRYFGVFSATLKQAVQAVGPAPAALFTYLHKPRALHAHAGGRYRR